MSNKRKWEGFKQKVAKKQIGKNHESSTLPADTEYMTVQRLSSTVEGKCQKYSRIGPLTMVPITKHPVTLDSIQLDCQKHFRTSAACNVLAGERGPSCTNVSQIKNWKVVHIRFLDASHCSSVQVLDDSHVQVEPRRSTVSEDLIQCTGISGVTDSKVPASVPLSQMLNIGKLIKPKKEIITLQLEQFEIKEKKWKDPMEVKISVNTEKFASGGFRDAFEAEAISGIRPGKYVLKRYKQNTIASIIELFMSAEIHTRKAVQINALARNFSQFMEQEKPEEFGNTFLYTKVYFAKYCDEYITLEDYIDGEFCKYVNNNGDILPLPPSKSDVGLKAQCYCHYTYVKSGKQLMVLDIQGVDYQLCDPEISSTNLKDTADENILFCCGNLSFQAIENFFTFHVCNKYCELMKLPKE